MAKPHAKKGASRNAKSNKNFLERLSLAKFLLAASLVVLAVVVYGSFSAVHTVLNVPVSQVDVEGSFHYLTEDEVNRVINNYVDNGFVSVDLANLREEFLAVPWIYQASVRRQLPNGLLVTLVEQKPVAFWNEDGMVNDAGELFFPSSLPRIEGLPYLKGKNHTAVLSLLRELQQHLPEQQQPIKRLVVSESNVVNVETVAGAVLIFNAGSVLEKMQMWRTISAGDLGSRLGEVDYVDLRYSNGAAVKWKDAAGGHAQTHKQTGVM